MKVAICDDSKEYISILEKYISDLNDKSIGYDVFLSGEELVYAYEHNQADYDVIFMDMEMDRLDGIDTANLVRKKDKHVIIVFVTSHTKYMQRSFECMPFRFLVKPIDFEVFAKAYNEICIKMADNPDTFIFLENKKRTRVFCSNIVFFESNSHSILIHTKDGTIHKTRKTMSELLETVGSSNFQRIHRAYVINMAHVYQIGESEVTMHNYDRPIPVSRTYKDELEDAFLNFKERKYLL